MILNLTVKLERQGDERDDPERVADFVRWQLLAGKIVNAGGAEGGAMTARYVITEVTDGAYVDDED